MGGEQVLSYSGALALNHHIILAVSVSCMPNPACGHTYSMNIGGVHYQGFKQKIKPRYHGLRLLHLLALTPGQEGRRPMTMRGQKRCPMLPGKSHGRRSLEDCSPWSRWGSDMTERLHFHFSLSCIREGNGNPLQCSCLENPRDGGAWWATVYGVAQSRTRLKQLSSSSTWWRGAEHVCESSRELGLEYGGQAVWWIWMLLGSKVVEMEGPNKNDWWSHPRYFFLLMKNESMVLEEKHFPMNSSTLVPVIMTSWGPERLVTTDTCPLQKQLAYHTPRHTTVQICKHLPQEALPRSL